jgi:hypothetical protein
MFVRPLSMEEGRRLQRIASTAEDPVRLRRGIVVLMSGQGQLVPDIASMLQVSADYVRDVSVIHAFNERSWIDILEHLRASEQISCPGGSERFGPGVGDEDGVGDHVVTPHNDSRRGEPGGPDRPSTDSQQPGTVPAAIWHRAPADSTTDPG